MDINGQLDRIRAQEQIEDNGIQESRLVFRAAVYAFRKWLSPVRSPAKVWIGNVETMLVKCHLANDVTALTELLAVRACAQIGATISPGDYDQLSLAAGLDVVAGAANGVGTGLRVTIDTPNVPDGAYVVEFRGVSIIVHDAPIEGRLETNDVEEAAMAIDRLATRHTGGQRYTEVGYEKAAPDQAEIFDTVHDPWRPTTVYNAELKAHPRRIIEPSTLAATTFPPATYKPLLPAEALKRGFISDAQFETIVYGLQAITTHLPGSPLGRHGRSPKGGFIIGDGTGVGKTNEFMGIIMDQWMRDHKRHIIVVEREKHVPHIREAWGMIGGSSRDIMFQGELGAKDQLPDRDAVMVTTYALIRNEDRYTSLIEWANGRREMDGVIVFDEAHNMRNAVEDNHEEGSGKRNQSAQGQQGVRLQGDLPEAGVIYASATMATDVYNLGYAPRLGLWGEKAPFASVEAFVSEMYQLDEGALEQICIDLKAAGRYVSRTLSFDGVEYDEIIHRLTPKQRRMFNGAVKNWKELSRMLSASHEITGGRASANHGRLSHMRRSLIEQMLSTFNVDTMIEDIHREIAEGNAPVIQIAMTGEARLKRVAEERAWISADDYIDKEIIKWIEDSFPECKMIYDKHTGTNVPVMINGQPVTDSVAVGMKQRAREIADELAIRQSALDRLYLEFGEERIAEVTGRSIRALPDIKAGKLTGWRIEERSSRAAMDDVEAFHDGRKQILVFSLAAGGSGLGYQAAEKSKNKARRIHYILELGRRAESAVQGLGRTHRADQVIAPRVKLVTSDIPAHAIYSARTLHKISKMGALSRGHQHAASNAIFEQRIPITGKYAQRGWSETIRAIEEGEIGDITIGSLASDLGLKQTGEESVRSLERAINNLAIISDGDQRLIVDSFTRKTEEAIATAIRNGEYNQGMETIRADSIELVDEMGIVNANGSTTTYYRLRRKDTIERIPFRRAATTAAQVRAKGRRAVFMRHKVNGRIVLGMMHNAQSSIIDVIAPSGASTRSVEAIRSEPWKVIDDHAEAERNWNQESENLDLRAESDLHILSGSLLYNWDKLPKTGIGLNRCRTDDGKVLVGRVIHTRDLRSTLAAMGMKSSYRPAQIATMLGKVDAGAHIEIDNGWSIRKPHSGTSDYRLVIPDEEQTGSLRQQLSTIGVIAYDTPLGFELEVPRSSAVDIIQSLAVGCDISLSGVTVTNSIATPANDPAELLAIAACKS